MLMVKKDLAPNDEVVACCGCFDILHAGHVTFLEKAKSYGDYLIVLLNSDKSIRKLKGRDRPIIPQDQRKLILEALECVDEVILFDEERPTKILKKLKPDIFVNSSEYGKDYEGPVAPKIKLIKNYPKISTSKIIEKIKSN
jgi:D-beta-D-heptose 7-phosphate kinase/D-beta-D-heptose 1-phosphate adenosyltransferase